MVTHAPHGVVDARTSGLPLPTLPHPPLPQVPVGGRLAHFVDKWEEITDDTYVLSIVRKGYMIPFHTPPPLSLRPVCFPVKDSTHTSLLLSVVDELLEKKAVEIVVDQGSPGFYSRLFLVKKKNGKLRPVIDLSPLNKCVQLEHFKMETQRSVRIAIQNHFWSVSIDLQDAYLHVPIRPSHRKYLRFALCGRVFQFRVLPFGLSSAPMVFTRLMKCVAAFIRRQGPSLLQYLDDWLVYHLSREVVLRHLSTVWAVVIRLGYCQPGQVRSGTESEVHLYRYELPRRSRYSESTHGQGGKYTSTPVQYAEETPSYGERVSFTAGYSQCGGGVRGNGQITSAPITVHSAIAVDSTHSPAVARDLSRPDGLPPSIKLVVGTPAAHTGRAHARPEAPAPSVYGLEPIRMGGGAHLEPQGGGQPRCLATRSGPAPHSTCWS